MLLKSINSTAQANLFERASGVHIESEQVCGLNLHVSINTYIALSD